MYLSGRSISKKTTDVLLVAKIYHVRFHKNGMDSNLQVLIVTERVFRVEMIKMFNNIRCSLECLG
jgi:hypothetical protein